MIDVDAIAKFYGGTVCNGNAMIPTPGHSGRDRGTAIKPCPTAPDGVLVACFNGGTTDALATKDMLRRDGFISAHSTRARAKSATILRTLERERQANERQRRKDEGKAERTVRALWSNASRASAGHSYLISKQLEPFGIRQAGDALLVPMVDARFQLRNVQRIRSDGRKLFAKGARTAGLFWPHALHLSDGKASAGPLVIGEGFATVAVIHAETGLGVAAAMSARNLEATACAMRQLFPARPIIVAADMDLHLQANTGLEAAKKAAEAVNGTLALPCQESSESGSGVDFADIPRGEIAARIIAANNGRAGP